MNRQLVRVLVPLCLCSIALVARAEDDANRNPEAAPAARSSASGPADMRASDAPAFPPPPVSFADAQPGVAQGTVEEFGYDSAVTGTRRKASVYLPAGYTPKRRYPVLYLLHGIAGNQDEWRGYVRANAVLDNAIANGKAVPMIVVMPNGRASADDRPPSADRVFTPEHVAAFGRFERDLLDHLIPAIDAKYPTLADLRHRAIAGLSMGGGQALNIGLGHLEAFAWVGGFSSAPNTQPAAQLLPDADAARRQLALLYLSCGDKDGLFKLSQELHRQWTSRGIAHVWNVDGHGHDRESWAENLYHFSQRLFR
jgi:enterochelin esterase-like enzyme